ncbi:NACHT domain-containing protein [Nocardia uniformis]|uniref:NACHT domain-containing protein n=1 Tax=Nocardia uniformis TaxID=53432 RepID=A0A849C3J0_9NOCA|nr:NACHT domain-containing protein [Nocardia uniformis]NNH71010.1 NACHT domain-containing protein [Nocardia uniformis]
MAGADIAVAGRVAAGPAMKGSAWLWRRLRPETTRAALDAHADELAELVERVETRRLTELGVVRGEQIDVSWTEQVRTRERMRTRTGSLSELCGYYGDLDTGRLVVLGAAGSGKTVIAMWLLLDLLAKRKDTQQRSPVPVRMNVASWDPESVGFARWVSSQLVTHYSVNRRVAEQLVESGRILPVLDGLDEMTDGGSHRRPRCALDRLNEPEWRGRPVVLTCRDDAYRAMRDLGANSGLRSAAAVTMRRLSPSTVNAYLSFCRDAAGIDADAWNPVTEWLGNRRLQVLADALSTPWVLSLAVAYLTEKGEQGALRLVAAASGDELREVLLASLVPAAAATQSTGAHGQRKYTAGQVQTWLAMLALHMATRASRGCGGTDIALNDLWELAARRSRLLHAIVAIVAGMVAGTVFVSPLTVPLGSPSVRLWGTLVISVALGSLFGLLTSNRPRRMIWRFTSVGARRRWLKAFRRGCVVLVSLLVPFVLVCVLVYRLDQESVWQVSRTYAVFGLGFGLPLAVGVVLITGLTAHAEPQANERRVIRDDAVAGIAIAAMVTVLAVLTHAMVVPTTQLSLLIKLAELAVFNLIGGVALAMLVSRAAVRYACARIFFVFTPRFPARPIQFLEWARSTGLLRVTGAAYQFRHQTFGDWLRSTS